MKKKIIYIAENGEEFTNEADCREYEEKLLIKKENDEEDIYG